MGDKTRRELREDVLMAFKDLSWDEIDPQNGDSGGYIEKATCFKNIRHGILHSGSVRYGKYKVYLSSRQIVSAWSIYIDGKYTGVNMRGSVGRKFLRLLIRKSNQKVQIKTSWYEGFGDEIWMFVLSVSLISLFYTLYFVSCAKI